MLPLLLILTAMATSDVTSASPCRSVVTFNTALLHNVDRNYETRFDDVTTAVGGLDADLVCLQEVWLESDMHKILDKLGHQYPHHYSSLHYRQGDLRKPASEMSSRERNASRRTIVSPCSFTDIINFGTRVKPCALSKGCLSLLSDSPPKALQCISQNCRPALMAVRSSCVSCVVLMSGGIAEVNEACSPDLTEILNALNPPGLLLLSKTPMTKLKYEDYFPGTRAGVARGSLEAEVEGIGKIVCTHLTSMDPVYYEAFLDFGSFQAQHRAEIQTLLKRFGNESHLLVGDLNTGPAVVDMEEVQRNLTAEEEGNFQMLIEAGYSSPYLESDGRCTFCSHNPLVNNSYNVAIDYIMSKNLESLEISNTYRVLDQVTPHPLSDHFGVMAEVCPES